MPKRAGYLFATVITVCQIAAAPLGRDIGELTKVDLAGGRIRIRTDDGAERDIAIPPGLRCLRVSPGEKDLSKAVPITPADLKEGDRVLVRSAATAQGATAETVIVMAKADILKKQAAERAEWNRRGILGRVAAVDTAAGEIVLATNGAQGPARITVTTSATTSFRRYRPDSVKFSDAQPSRLAEIHAGDQMRALGRRSEDGSRYAADEIVTGAFRTVAAVIVSVDPEGRTLKATDLDVKKPVLVHVTPESNLRRLAPMAAAMLAARARGGGVPSSTPPPRTPDLQALLERMPALTLDELKAGDAILVASTEGATPGAVTAITMLAGVEPLLTAPSGEQRSALGSWNLDLNMNMNIP